MKPECVAIYMKAIEQFFHGYSLFSMLYKAVLTFTFADETTVHCI